MTKALEDNRWIKEKRPVIDEYLTTAKKVENLVAGQGFLHRPGFLGAAITDIERFAKFKLSDINYQIVAQAIERELAQTGFNYDIVVKEAMITWELEKSTLLTTMQQDFADNKALRSMDNQELDRLEITTNLRKLVIMASKTALDVEMEGYRQEMTLVDQSTFHAEDALLAAKLTTARKKLEVIPYIETVLEKQQLVITAEGDNADRKNALITVKENLNDKREDLIDARELIAGAIIELIAAKQALVIKRATLIGEKELVAAQDTINVGYLEQYISTLSGLDDVRQDLITAKKALIPYINNKSLALIAYAAELDAWIVVKEAIAVIKEQMATLSEERVDKRGDVIDARVDLNTLKLALQEANIDLEIAKMTGRTDLMTQKIGNAAEMLAEREASFDAKISRESALISGQIDLDLYDAKIAFETMSEVNDIEFDGFGGVSGLRAGVIRIARARIAEKKEIAEIASEAKITSQLIHLLA